MGSLAMLRFEYNKKGLFFVRMIPLLICLLCFGRVCAQSKKDKVFQSLKLELGLSPIYNDNILKYSDYYLTKFLNNQDSGRFYINTSDGVVLEQSIKIAPIFLFFGKNKTVFEGKFTRQTYINNKIKNWNQIDLGIQQYINRRIIINLSYSYLPKYYVRHYRDDDWVDIYGYTPETFQPFEYAKNEYGFWFQNAFFKKKNTRLRLSFDFEQYFYNEHFTEYDCNNMNYTFSFHQFITNKLKIETDYQFIVSNAKGCDDIQETRDNSDDSDPSYNADKYSGTIKWTLPVIYKKPHILTADFEYKRSCFSSKHYLEIDRMHAGRIDDLYKMGFSYEVRMSKPIAISVFYKWCKQDSDTKAEANKVYISQEKDYTQQQFGLSLTYVFNNVKFSRCGSEKTD
jgi:hypothetical protein